MGSGGGGRGKELNGLCWDGCTKLLKIPGKRFDETFGRRKGGGWISANGGFALAVCRKTQWGERGKPCFAEPWGKEECDLIRVKNEN